MRREAWHRLLERMVRLTEGGGASWQAADDVSGTYVLSEPSGSVVLQIPREPVAITRHYVIEVRDAEGNVRAELSLTESPLGGSTHALMDLAPLISLVKRLTAVIEEGDKAVEDLADTILSEAEHGFD